MGKEKGEEHEYKGRGKLRNMILHREIDIN
jgi:hypothetical protein